MTKKQEDQEERDQYNFNCGRKNCENYWLEEIDDRIKELEDKYGITELKRLRKKTKYNWEA